MTSQLALTNKGERPERGGRARWLEPRGSPGAVGQHGGAQWNGRSPDRQDPRALRPQKEGWGPSMLRAMEGELGGLEFPKVIILLLLPRGEVSSLPRDLGGL